MVKAPAPDCETIQIYKLPLLGTSHTIWACNVHKSVAEYFKIGFLILESCSKIAICEDSQLEWSTEFQFKWTAWQRRHKVG